MVIGDLGFYYTLYLCLFLTGDEPIDESEVEQIIEEIEAQVIY